MNLGKLSIIFFLTLVIFIPACKATATRDRGEPKILATVNGVAITGDDVVQRMGGHERLLNTPMKDRILEEIIADELLYQKGVQLGLDKDAKFQGMVRMMELRVTEYKRAEMARRVRDTQLAAKVNVTEQDVKDYYNKNAEEIKTDLHLGLLHFDTPDEARDSLARLRAGSATFEKIAAERFSHMPKGNRQTWDRGFMHWNQISPDLLRTVYSLKAGEISDVIDRSPNGSFLIKVIDRKKDPNVSFSTMSTAVENRLNAIKTKEAYDRYLEQLRKKSTIRKQ